MPDLQEIDEIPELVDLETPKTAKAVMFPSTAQQFRSLKLISMKSWPKRQKEQFDSGDYFCEKEITTAMESRSNLRSEIELPFIDDPEVDSPSLGPANMPASPSKLGADSR